MKGGAGALSGLGGWDEGKEAGGGRVRKQKALACHRPNRP